MKGRIARPYAAALFAVLARQDAVALRAAEAGLFKAAEAFRLHPELLRAFEIPSIPPAVKRELLGKVAESLALGREVGRLLVAMEQHFRLSCLADVAVAFRRLVDRREGVVRARVELPAPVTGAQRAALEKELAVTLSARVEVETEVRPELLAGFVVRVGSQVFDGSLRRQLERFATPAER